MNKNIIFAALISFMFVFSLQIAEPVAAYKLKVVDKGHISHPGDWKYSWKTYQRGTSYVNVHMHVYDYKTKQTSTYDLLLKKGSKNKLKWTSTISGKYDDVSYKYIITRHEHTKLTAARFYWRAVRPEMLAGNIR